MKKYNSETEKEMVVYFSNLSEKDKRTYAALEAKKLGFGGLVYISKLFGISRQRIARGIKESKLTNEDQNNNRCRKVGGGRKPYYIKFKGINAKFLEILKNHTAGNPMKDDILWTNLTRSEISELFKEKYNLKVSLTVIKKLLKYHKYKRRQAKKCETMKESKNRDAQFNKINNLINLYMSKKQPIISVDTKKKSI